MPRLFGTDGVRGLANGELTAALALGLAQASAAVLTHGHHADARRASGRPRPRAVLARDPRVSGEFLGAAVAAGLASAGVDVLDAGVIPTPAAAYLVADIDADFGVMISASHNPAPDNGIKFSSPPVAASCRTVEDRIEAAMHDHSAPHPDRRRRRTDHTVADRRGPLRRAPARHAPGAARRHPRGARPARTVLPSAVSPEVFVNAGAR